MLLLNDDEDDDNEDNHNNKHYDKPGKIGQISGLHPLD